MRMFLVVRLSSESRVKDRRDQTEKLYLYTAVQIREALFAGGRTIQDKTRG